MPLPTSSPRAGLAARLATVLAIVIGLLGMHVLMSPASHSAHGSPGMMAAADDPAAGVVVTTDRTGDHAAAAVPAAAAAGLPHHAEPAAPCSDHCADPAGGSAPGVWAVICVLALLTAFLLLFRRTSSWLLPWRALRRTATTSAREVDRAPRHPPSLIVLSISRT